VFCQAHERRKRWPDIDVELCVRVVQRVDRRSERCTERIEGIP